MHVSKIVWLLYYEISTVAAVIIISDPVVKHTLSSLYVWMLRADLSLNCMMATKIPFQGCTKVNLKSSKVLMFTDVWHDMSWCDQWKYHWTHCGLVTPYAETELLEHWLRYNVLLPDSTKPLSEVNLCWLITRNVQWHSLEGYFTGDTSTTNH